MFSCSSDADDVLVNLAEMPQVFFVPGPHLDSPRPPPPMVSYSPLLFPLPDPHLLNKILNQINYYFRYLLLVFSLHFLVSTKLSLLFFFFSLLSCSNENLVKDIHLRKNMDREGWVSVHLIAGFNKVSCLQDIVISLMLSSSKLQW